MSLDGLARTGHGWHAVVVTVREMRRDEASAVLAMMRLLWPGAEDGDLDDDHVFVWEREDGSLGGFASVSVRPWAEGCQTEPVPYVEGWYVAVDLRRRGVGAALLGAVEEWARAGGHAELGSDVEVDNEGSLAAHLRLGYEPTTRLQFFRKLLRPQGSSGQGGAGRRG
jgi:aminoglycoside 6'-N-acetyltransferase I